jgi:hypothetical protein
LLFVCPSIIVEGQTTTTSSRPAASLLVAWSSLGPVFTMAEEEEEEAGKQHQQQRNGKEAAALEHWTLVFLWCEWRKFCLLFACINKGKNCTMDDDDAITNNNK